MRELARCFSALADPTRLEMLALLLHHGELCVCDFVRTLGITQSKASRDLRSLWNVRLVEDRRAGLWVHYRIAPGLDAERKAIVAAADRIFRARDMEDLFGRLDRWLTKKGQTVPAREVAARRSGAPRARTPQAARRVGRGHAHLATKG